MRTMTILHSGYTGYIHFCVDNIIPKKIIKKYPNSKDYSTPDIKKEKGSLEE